MYSKSCQDFMNVVSAMPVPAKAKPISQVAGQASTAHQDDTSPIAAITTTNPAAYTADRISDQASSPRAMSMVRIGVASTPS
jgi:hypothetical protein